MEITYENAKNANIDDIVNNIIENCTFPYKKFWMNENDVKIMFERLICYEPLFKQDKYKLNVFSDRYLIPWNFEGKQIVLPIGNDEYDNIDIITDYFSEENRMQAKMMYAEKSPIQAWNDVKLITKIVNNLIENQKDINMKELREQIYQNIPEATQFKTTLAISFYKKFKANNVLDISAGWGDRLIAAIAHNVNKYLAYDPNKSLKPAHDKIIDMFGQEIEINIK